jgi:hypothetical protein
MSLKESIDIGGEKRLGLIVRPTIQTIDLGHRLLPLSSPIPFTLTILQSLVTNVKKLAQEFLFFYDKKSECFGLVLRVTSTCSEILLCLLMMYIFSLKECKRYRRCEGEEPLCPKINGLDCWSNNQTHLSSASSHLLYLLLSLFSLK